MISLKEIIKDYKNIAVFRHENPDGDALGSQFALKYWIEENFKDKTVKALGYQSLSNNIFPLSDEADEDFIKNSLAIILDTANCARIDDQRYKSAIKIIKIDHHPNNEPFGDIQFVDPKYAATCEIMATLFFNEGLSINSETAAMLYRGILTDTLCFKTNNTTEHTLMTAAKLVKYNLNISQINRELFNISINTFNFKTKLREKLKLEKKVGYIIYTNKEIEEAKLNPGEIRSYIDEIGNIKELEAWCIFTEKIVNGKKYYDGSLRSKNIAVNKIAMMFNGGGHKNASGIKNIYQADINKIIDLLNKEYELIVS